MLRLSLLAALVVAAPLAGTAALAAPPDKLEVFTKLSTERDWPWWRGPARNGIAADTATPPTTWDSETNVVWNTPVPGRGHASPVVVKDRIFLATADEKAKVQSVVAFDRATGKQLWQTEVSQGGFVERTHPKNTEATSTLASDGKCVIATFCHHKTIEAIALDLDGKELWRTTVGPFDPQKYQFGYAPSPLIYRNTVIVALEWDRESFLYALDLQTGKEAWRAPRPDNVSYSSPVVAHVAGRDQLLISGANLVASYDPNNGKPLWSVEGTTDATCSTIVWEGDLVFATGGYPGSETLAVRADGSGEVVWRNRQRCYEQSMLVTDGYLYSFTDSGVAYCWRAIDGEQQWSQRLRGPVSASPVLANGNIYQANEAGLMYVFKATPERFELIAENQLGTEAFASPVVLGKHIFLRVPQQENDQRQEYLYCLGE